jgi:hypothetical protein
VLGDRRNATLLMAQQQVLRFKPPPRLEQIDDENPERSAGLRTSALIMGRFSVSTRIALDGISERTGTTLVGRQGSIKLAARVDCVLAAVRCATTSLVRLLVNTRRRYAAK